MILKEKALALSHPLSMNPREVTFEHSLQELQNQMISHRVVLIVGRRLSGKSTLLNQLRKLPSSQASTVDWEDDIDLHENFNDRIKTALSPNGTPLVATLESLDKVELNLLSTLGVYRWNGLQPDELKCMALLAKVEVSEDFLETDWDLLMKGCQGSPVSFQHLLGICIREDRPLDRVDAHDTIIWSHGETLRKIAFTPEHLRGVHTIQTLIDHGQMTEAAQAFGDLAPSFEAIGDSASLFRLGKALLPHLSLKTFLRRQRHLLLFQDPATSVEELRTRLLLSADPHECFEYRLHLIYPLTHLQKLEEAAEVIETLQKPSDPLDYFRWNIALLYYETAKDIKLARQRSEYLNQLKANAIDFPPLILGDCATIQARLERYVFSQIEAVRLMKKAVNYYSLAEVHFERVTLSRNLSFFSHLSILNETRLDDLREFQIQTAFLNWESQFNSWILAIACKNKNKGAITVSINRTERTLQLFFSKNIIRPSDLRTIHTMFYFYLEAKQYLKAKEIIDHLFLHADWRRSSSLVPFYSYAGLILQQVIIGNYSSDRISEDFKKIGEESAALKIRVLEFLMVISLNTYLPWKLESILSTVLDDMKNTDFSFFSGTFSCFFGWHFITYGKLKIAEDCLSRANSAAHQEYCLQDIAMSELGMAVLDFRFARWSSLDQRILLLKKLLPKTDFREDYYLVYFLEALRQGRSSISAMRILEKLPRKHPVRYLFQLTYDRISQNEFSELNLTPQQRQYFETLLIRLGVENIKRVRITTLNKEIILLKSQFDLQTQQHPILLDTVSGILRIGPKKLNLSEKRALVPLLKFMMLNSGLPLTKETLTAQVWHERYNPLVHDTRIHTSIRRLRALIRQLTTKEWIFTKEGAYLFQAHKTFTIAEPLRRGEEFTANQRWILAYLRRNPDVDRRSIQELLKLKPSSCKKELLNLTWAGMIEPYGKGPATRYRLSSTH